MKQDYTRKSRSIYFQEDIFVSGRLFGWGSWKRGRISATRWCTEDILTPRIHTIYISYSRPKYSNEIYQLFNKLINILIPLFDFRALPGVFLQNNELFHINQQIYYSTEYTRSYLPVHHVFTCEGKRLLWSPICISRFCVQYPAC